MNSFPSTLIRQTLLASSAWVWEVGKLEASIVFGRKEESSPAHPTSPGFMALPRKPMKPYSPSSELQMISSRLPSFTGMKDTSEAEGDIHLIIIIG